MSFLDDSSSGGSSSEGEGGGKVKGATRKIKLGSSKGGNDDRLQVNEKFAKRFDQQKREQELQAAKHLDIGSDGEGSGSDSESETEDEDAEMLTPALDLQIMKTINKIRSKDPSIYNTDKEWFAEEGSASGVSNGAKKSEKRMRYKDVVREQILGAETAEDAISSDENSDDDGANNSGHGGARGLVYDQEQEQLRKGFLGSVAEHEGGVGEGSDSSGEEDGEGESGLLKVRSETPAEAAEEEELLKKEADKMAEAGDGGEEDTFLRDFVANRRWLDPNAKETPSYDEILNAPHVEDSDDEMDVDRADDFESKYNFRFEEEGGGEIAMHSRNIAGSMRRKDDRRKRERESRKARKAEERQKKEAELRRLKNLKREEIRRRLQAIQEMSGGALVDDGEGGGVGGEPDGVGEDAQALIEGDFDAERWDAVTEKAFGDSYYNAEDADDGWKPGDDPLEGLGDLEQYDGDAGADEAAENGDETAANLEGEGREEGDGTWEEGGEEEEEDWEEYEEGGEDGEDFGGVGAQKEQLLDELYKLDYEDIIGDIPCRFKYTKVKSNDFGLTPEEILLADDKDLNKYVPLKKLAPYRTDEPKLDARRRRQLREEVKAREAAAEAEMQALRSKKRRRGKKKASASSSSSAIAPAELAANPTVAGAVPQLLPEADGSTGDGSKPPVTAELAGGKRRRRKKGQKKQRVQAGVGSGGGKDGQEEAELVPRVQPMSAVEDVDGATNPEDDDRDGGSSGRKKRGKKRSRLSGDDEEAQDESHKDRVAHEGGAEIADSGKAGQTAPAPVVGGGSIKKTRRGSSGKGGGGGGGGVSSGKEGDGGQRGKKKAKKGEGKAVKLAAAVGVSKSRLASYGL